MKQLYVIITLLLIAACTAPSSPTPEPPPRAASAPQPKLSQRCTHTQHGFSISYPEGWRTNDPSVLPSCTAFHPQPFEIPRDSEFPFEIAVVLHVEQVALDQLTRMSSGERVLSATEMTIAGRKAFRVEVESTGEGLADRGMRSLRYLVDLGDGRVLTASTHDRGDAYAQKQDVLARMMETVALR